MHRSIGPRRAWSSRPFFATVFCLTLAAACSLFAPVLFKAENNDSTDRRTDGHPSPSGGLGPRTNTFAAGCAQVHDAADQCAFVREKCMDGEAGLLPYLTFYYCDLARAKPVAFAILVSWLGLLFTTIGLAASDFFSVNLNTIASIMGMGESLAGVTFLAFGNGSPDLFSTFAAMGSGSAGMAVGELIGAASFISAVVAGSMALVREFRVDRNTYVRDICFFSVAVALTVGFIADGQLHFWECCLMIGYYLVYVTTVVSWHWWAAKKDARRALAGAAAAYSPAAGPSYRDDPEIRAPDRVGTGLTDISALDIDAPRIEIEGLSSHHHHHHHHHLNGGGNADEAGSGGGGGASEDQMSFAAEVTSNMRVLRPGGRRRSTLNPIRPSLLGALELRSALALAKREHIHRAKSFPIRSQSESRQSRVDTGRSSFESESLPGAANGPGRNRAVSSIEVWPDNSDDALLATPRLLRESHRRVDSAPSTLPPSVSSSQSRTRSVSPVPSFTIGGNLAPPPIGSRGLSRHEWTTESAPPVLPTVASASASASASVSVSARALQLRIPENGYHEGDDRPSTLLSPFPSYSDSPLPMTPYLTDVPATSSNVSPTEVRSLSQYFPPSVSDTVAASDTAAAASAPERQTRRRRGGGRIGGRRTFGHLLLPNLQLPSLDVVLRTLFPTVHGWRNKSIWDKFVSAISIPSIFLLVVTLPVVETEREDADAETEAQSVLDPPGLGATDNNGLAEIVAGAANASSGVESEWQRYRRYTRSDLPSPAVISISSPRQPAGPLGPLSRRSSIALHDSAPVFRPGPDVFPPRKQPDANGTATEGDEQEDEQADDGDDDDDDDDNDCAPPEWNRWLVALQIFTGPQFAAFVLWANWAEDLDRPQETLLQMSLWTILGSAALLALLLLTTSVSRRPKYHYLLCFLGFLISIAWISAIAGEVVGVLKAVGVILDISEAILGLTVFAAGNSIGDLVADITVARLGYPVMALSACFGGPMLNILLGIGLGGVGMMVKAAKRRKARHPDRPFEYRPFRIQVGGTLMVSAITLLVTLLALLVVVPVNRWMLTRRIGWALIALWSVSTVVNLVVEVTGVWKKLG